MTDRDYWERHARRYDSSLRVLARPIPRMLELTVAAVQGRARVLEVAAGTGLVTTAIAGVVAELVATDYADAMVERLAQRVREAGSTNVRCERADIYGLGYEALSDRTGERLTAPQRAVGAFSRRAALRPRCPAWSVDASKLTVGFLSSSSRRKLCLTKAHVT